MYNREEFNKMDKRIIDLYKESSEEDEERFAKHMASFLATSVKYHPDIDKFSISHENYKEQYNEWYKIFKK
jgi:hypothetical protein